MGTAVEDLGNALELLLAGRVPDLELEHLLLELYEEGAEFNPDRNLVVCHEFVVG